MTKEIDIKENTLRHGEAFMRLMEYAEKELGCIALRVSSTESTLRIHCQNGQSVLFARDDGYAYTDSSEFFEIGDGDYNRSFVPKEKKTVKRRVSDKPRPAMKPVPQPKPSFALSWKQEAVLLFAIFASLLFVGKTLIDAFLL